MLAALAQGSHLGGDVRIIGMISPHPTSRMLTGRHARPRFRAVAGGHKHRSFTTPLQNGHPLVTIEGPKDLRHPAAKTENAGFHGFPK